MRQRRQLAPDALELSEVELRVDDPLALRAFGQDAAPGIDDARMPVRLAPRMRLTGLRRRDHESLVFDRARACEYVPVRFARERRERRGHENHMRSFGGQIPIELRKSQVIADRKAHTAQWRFDHDGLLARLDMLGFVIVAIT